MPFGKLTQSPPPVVPAPDSNEPGARLSARARIGQTLRRPVIREGIWVLIGQAATAVALLVGTRITTEVVEPASYGVFVLILGICFLGRNAIVAPTLHAALRLYADAKRANSVAIFERVLRTLVAKAAIILVGVLLVGGVVHVAIIGKSGWDAPLTWLLLTAYVCVDSFRVLQLNLLQADRQQKWVSFLITTEAVAGPVILLTAVLILGSTASVVAVSFLCKATVGLILVRFLRRQPREGASAQQSDAAADETTQSKAVTVPLSPADLQRWTLAYGLPLMPMALVTWITAQSDRYLIGYLSGEDAAGIYAIVYGLINQPFLMAQGIISRTLMPILNDATANDDRRFQRRVLRTWLVLTIAICGTGVVLVFLLRELLALALLAPAYRSGVVLMGWLAVGSALSSIGDVFQSRLYSLKATRIVATVAVITSAISLVAVVALTRSYGAAGAAAAAPIYFGMRLVLLATGAARAARIVRSAGAAPRARAG